MNYKMSKLFNAGATPVATLAPLQSDAGRKKWQTQRLFSWPTSASHPNQAQLKPNKPFHFPLPAELQSKLQRPTLAPGCKLDWRLSTGSSGVTSH